MAVARDAIAVRLATFAAVASVYYLCAGVAVHLLNPAFNPIRNYISDYAVGAYGFVYTSAYWVTMTGCLALAVALFRQLPSGKVGAILIVVFGLTYALTAIFPTELLKPGEFPHGAAGAIHALAALIGWIAAFTGALLVSGASARQPELKAFAGPLRALAWLMVLAFVGVIAVMASRQPVAGLAEKIFITLREVWLLLAAIGVARAAGTISPVDA
jgi:hypothetical membrane protein